MDVFEGIQGRRSVRRFAARPVPREAISALVEAACAAPAPHRTRPWRFVEVRPETREGLAGAMATAWRRDLEADGRPPDAVQALLDRSRRQLVEAPLLLLACLQPGAAAPAWPDERRRSAERDMHVQSLGAALQNLLLAAHSEGLAGYLKGAPVFCPDTVAKALDLPQGWQPCFLVLLGYPDPAVRPSPRPEFRLDDFLATR